MEPILPPDMTMVFNLFYDYGAYPDDQDFLKLYLPQDKSDSVKVMAVAICDVCRTVLYQM